MSIDVESVYRQSLTAMLAAERRGLARMQTHLDELGDHAEYGAILRRHIATTTQQIDRIEKAATEVGAATDRDEDAEKAEIESMTRAVAPTKILGNLYAGYAFQYEQIAAYTSLEVIATAAGHAGHKAWIEQAIKEERSAADAVDRLIGSITRAFLAHE